MPSHWLHEVYLLADPCTNSSGNLSPWALQTSSSNMSGWAVSDATHGMYTGCAHAT